MIGFDSTEVKATNGYRVHNLNTGLNYTTIQGAIGASETLDGHTIFVEAGVYYEHITINKETSLIGEDIDTTIIDGNGTGYVVTMIDGRISGFTIRSGEYGVNFQGSHCEVDGNAIVSNLKHGIEIYSYGTVTISNNLITSNGRNGIFAYGYLGDEYHKIEGNTIVSNGWNDIILFASKCSIVGNVIGGIELWMGAFETLIYNNYFYGDVERVSSESSASFNIAKTFTESGNIVGGPYLGGNFWSSRSGGDNDLDGIGDSPHYVYWCHSYDNLPLVRQNGIYIMADGTVFPSSAPILSLNNATYTLTENINGSLLISRNNITFTGNGYTIQGAGDGEGIGLAAHNTTIKNTTVRGFKEGVKLHSSSYNNLSGNITNNEVGIYFCDSSYNTLSGSNITNNEVGVSFYDSSNNNTIYENVIANNYYGICFRNSSNYNAIHRNVIANNTRGIEWISEGSVITVASHSNVFYHNNFISNSNGNWASANNTWDDGYPSGGNYWDDYEERYPNATEIDESGIWDTPYSVNTPWPGSGENVDNYPLIEPIPEFPSFLILPLFMIATLLAVIVYKKRAKSDRYAR
jgi:parallel beta-helix repeat protein